jgi:hypothetical protein
VISATSAPSPDPEDIRTEYTAIADYQRSVDTFRFTTLGFYLAAVGLVAGNAANRAGAALLLGITVALALLEIRNRSLLKTINIRGLQIEREVWGRTGPRAYEGFFSGSYRIPPDPAVDPTAPELPPPDESRMFGRAITRSVGYTMGFDVLFVVVAVYSIYMFVRGHG